MNGRLLLLCLLGAILSGCAGFSVQEQAPGAVTFMLRNGQAREVALATSLDQYRPHSVEKNQFGLWQVSVPARATFSYFYLVDGAVYLPDCEFRETDDFGFENCLYLASR